ncbi:MAG: efflux RND transporter periplasmic adaptor subunit [Bacteroidetes bacterium]|nr:efflux RND transporter periplasmic adaptor subunit [Bacteroidota bacterium]MCL5737689.1 efflux RND transporter periplasmic adaptor subunit [Bacteroidota bacterium]
MKSKKLVAVAVVLALFLGMVVILRLNSQTREDRNGNSREPRTVEVTYAKLDSISGVVSASGTLRGTEEADIISETNGKVVKIFARLDQYLRRNAPIVEVENDIQEIALEQAQAQAAAAQASHEKADLDLKRITNLYKQNVVSETQLEGAQLAAKSALAQYRGAQAALKLAQKHYDDTFIKTPIAGRLAQKFFDIGGMITPGMKVATVVEDSRMKLKVGIPEESIALIKPGQQARVECDAIPGKVFAGRVKDIALKADPTTRTFQVDIELPNDAQRSLKSGMFARASITTSEKESALVIPSSALVETDGTGPKVYIVKDSLVSIRDVEVGTRDGSKVRILSGLKPGAMIITFGQQDLVNASRVNYKIVN